MFLATQPVPLRRGSSHWARDRHTPKPVLALLSLVLGPTLRSAVRSPCQRCSQAPVGGSERRAGGAVRDGESGIVQEVVEGDHEGSWRSSVTDWRLRASAGVGGWQGRRCRHRRSSSCSAGASTPGWWAPSRCSVATWMPVRNLRRKRLRVRSTGGVTCGSCLLWRVGAPRWGQPRAVTVAETASAASRLCPPRRHTGGRRG